MHKIIEFLSFEFCMFFWLSIEFRSLSTEEIFFFQFLHWRDSLVQRNRREIPFNLNTKCANNKHNDNNSVLYWSSRLQTFLWSLFYFDKRFEWDKRCERNVFQNIECLEIIDKDSLQKSACRELSKQIQDLFLNEWKISSKARYRFVDSLYLLRWGETWNPWQIYRQSIWQLATNGSLIVFRMKGQTFRFKTE